VSVEVTFIGRLGNNLFQYALGRIVAEHLGFELTCRESPLPPAAARSHKDTQSATLCSVASQFPNAPLSISGSRYSCPIEGFTLRRAGSWNGQTIDLAKVLADRSPRKIRLGGFFQRYEYYQLHLERIRSWFATTPGKENHPISSQDVLLNVRGGADFQREGWTLDPTYYVSALKRMTGVGTIFVCGVGISAGIRATLAPFNPVYVDGAPMDHFRLIQRFNRIVVPNSTFSWWAALLSSASEIYIPEVADKSRYSFKTAHVDLEVDDGRYIKIPSRLLFGERSHAQASPRC
jgi:hypothetical protein